MNLRDEITIYTRSIRLVNTSVTDEVYMDGQLSIKLNTNKLFYCEKLIVNPVIVNVGDRISYDSITGMNIRLRPSLLQNFSADEIVSNFNSADFTTTTLDNDNYIIPKVNMSDLKMHSMTFSDFYVDSSPIEFDIHCIYTGTGIAPGHSFDMQFTMYLREVLK